MNLFILILIASFIGCLLALVVFLLINERTVSNLSFAARLNWKYNCLAILHQEICSLRLEGDDYDKIQSKLQKKYEEGAFRFMLSRSISKTDVEANSFIGIIIGDKRLLFGYAAKKNLTRKDLKQLSTEINADKREKEAKLSLLNILKDKSPQSIDDALRWLPQLMIDFVPDPEKPDETPSKSKYTAAIWYYLTKSRLYLEDVSYDSFVECLDSLRILNPGMKYQQSRNNSNKYTEFFHTGDDYDLSIRKRIETMKNGK